MCTASESATNHYATEQSDLPLRVESRKLAHWFVGPFEVDQMVNIAAVHLRLPTSLRVQPTFHVSQVKPVGELELLPAAEEPPPPPPAQFITHLDGLADLGCPLAGPWLAVPGGLGGVWPIGSAVDSSSAHAGPESPADLLPRPPGKAR